MSQFLTSVIPHPGLLIVLWLHRELDPPGPDWDAAMTWLTNVRRSRNIASHGIRQLVISDGGGPNATQRAQAMREFHRGVPCKLAVVTTALWNPAKRGLATALSWFNPLIRFYEPRRFLDALEYLDLIEQREAVWLEFHKLEARLGPVYALRHANQESRLRAGWNERPRPERSVLQAPHKPRTSALVDTAAWAGDDWKARLRTLSTAQRGVLARTAGLHDRLLLEQYHGASVWEALLCNPRLTRDEVERIAANPLVTAPVVELILHNRRWISDNAIRAALLRNPRISGAQLDQVLSTFSHRELRDLATQSEQRIQVRIGAQCLLGDPAARPPGARPFSDRR